MLFKWLRKKQMGTIWIRGIGWALLLSWLMIGWPPSEVGAAPEAQISAAQYIDRSGLIFVGRLVDKESFFSEDRRLILTRYLFAVVEPIKGRPRDRESLVEYGGEMGGLRLTLSHGVTYEAGLEYLIFAETGPNGALRTLGGQEGRLPVISDSAGERHVRLNPGHPLRGSFGDSSAAIRPVRELRSAIDALGGGAGR